MADRGFTYTDVFIKMTPQQVKEANIALDMQIAAEKSQMKKKKKR